MSIAHPRGRPGDNPPVTPAPLPFFVYGTLRPGETNHALFLSGRTLAEEPARLTGAVLYDGPGYPYALEVPGGSLHGDLVTVTPEYYPGTLRALDALEEYRAELPALFIGGLFRRFGWIGWLRRGGVHRQHLRGRRRRVKTKQVAA